MKLYLITFLPCETKFLVNQSSEEAAFQSAVEANKIIGEMEDEDIDLTDKSLYEIILVDFSELAYLFQKEPYWGQTNDTIIFDD